jgi:hypothetical protein
MSELNISRLESEWVTLQNQYDSYEKCSLAIKLTSVLFCGVLLFALHSGLWTAMFIAILWLQDGIWKTFQNRIGLRLEVIEQAIHQSQNDNNGTPEAGMQFNLAWAQSRPNTIGLVIEYVTQSCKPTVAYPHLLLIMLVGIYCYAGW